MYQPGLPRATEPARTGRLEPRRRNGTETLGWLPFRLLGWTLRGIGFLLALPFMLLAGLIGVLAFGAGAVLLFFPLVPLLLLGFAVPDGVAAP